MKKLILSLMTMTATAVIFLIPVSPAAAANETGSVGLTMQPQSKLFKQVAKPVNWRVDVEIKAPLTSPKVQPMKRVKVRFPRDMKFVPKKKTPVCPNNKIGPGSNLSFPPNTIIKRCPKSVLGNGTAGLYLAANNSASGPTLKDPVLVVFNGGRNSAGLPKIKIYGYSAGTGAGIYMSGVLNKGVLTVSIPVLTFDSAVGDFNLNIPGRDVGARNRRGKDKTYVRTRCSRGFWKTKARFVLGFRDTAGNSTSPSSFVRAPNARTNCKGKSGNPRIKRVKVRGSNKIRRGGSKVYRVRIKNSGTAVARGVKIRVGGRGVKTRNQRVGKIFPRTAKTAKVRVKLTGKVKRGRKTRIKFRVNPKNGKAKTVKKRVKVK